MKGDLIGGTPTVISIPKSHCGRTNPSRTTLKPPDTTVCRYLQANHHSRVSYVVQGFLHPQPQENSLVVSFQEIFRFMPAQLGDSLRTAPQASLRSHAFASGTLQHEGREHPYVLLDLAFVPAHRMGKRNFGTGPLQSPDSSKCSCPFSNVNVYPA